MTLHARRRAISFGLALTGSALAGSAFVTVGATPAAAACSAVDIVFARGSLEAQGLGIVGTPFVNSLKADLPGRTVSSYAVVYAADAAQTSATAGSADLVRHVTSVAASCPSTRFVLGGYSQGATVVDKALGIRTGLGGSTVLPAAAGSRVRAIAAFGNPLGLQGQTIATASSTYGPRSKDYCNSGDPVCGGGFNIFAHLTYGTNGSTTDAARLAAAAVLR